MRNLMSAKNEAKEENVENRMGKVEDASGTRGAGEEEEFETKKGLNELSNEINELKLLIMQKLEEN